MNDFQKAMEQVRDTLATDLQEVQAEAGRCKEMQLTRWADKVLVGGNQRAVASGVDISGALAGVRKASASIDEMARNFNDGARSWAELTSGMDYRMPSRPNDRRTVRVLGKAKHWYADRDGKLHLADGESPWI